MTFQYFFFDTYAGYFFQALPIALSVSILYGLIRFGRDQETPRIRKLWACVFVCYITGLVCLVIGLDLMNIVWYRLLYRMDPGRTVNWFAGTFDLVPDFFRNISGETVGNLLMFLPFGVLYPLSQKGSTWKNVVVKGLIVIAAIEILQPVLGRAFDINDILLNGGGVVVSTSAFMGVRRASRR